jgi:RNA polymerase sigma-70 factor, ECF subfamily
VDPEERFTVLYRAHYAAVLRYAVRRTDPDTARDVVADTFLTAWRRLADLPAIPAEIEPWLYGVARRSLANAQRSRRRAGRVTARLAGEKRVAAPAPDPADAVSAQANLQQALRQLSERDQEALRLIGWEELDLAAAALALGCSRATMAVRLHRARRRLASAMNAVNAVNAVDRAPRPADDPAAPITLHMTIKRGKT